MPGARISAAHIRSSCLSTQKRSSTARNRPLQWRSLCHSPPRHDPLRAGSPSASKDQKNHAAEHETSDGGSGEGKVEGKEVEQGALSRRLAQMSEEALETGGRGARAAVAEAGFSEDLKKQLEERIANATFRSEHASAFAMVGLASSASKHTRDLAGAAPWTGSESVEDASLRMLNDAHRPVRVRPSSPPHPGVRVPERIDTGHNRNKAPAAMRLGSARDRTSMYASAKDQHLSPEEREKLFAEMQARFEPHARAVPGTIQGLASLANERIEDAIARGQFKNLPRGRALERDYNASNPFLDTTEYFLNKMIQKQEIVPPWIEKQQELTAAANKFRTRLRADWKRHAARVIASRGGTLQEQLERARRYARAEERVNPKSTSGVRAPTADGPEHMSEISRAGEPHVRDQQDEPGSGAREDDAAAVHAPSAAREPPTRPFRDPTWLATESAYLTHAIAHLNALTRTYNLQAPDLAKKPYFRLERELAAAYADVAPLLAEEIHQRATGPTKAPSSGPAAAAASGVASAFRGLGLPGRGEGHRARVRDEDRGKRYGLREFWRDVFGG